MADNNDYLSDVSIDSILDDVRKLTGKDSDTKLWSLDEIDALLNDSKGEIEVSHNTSDDIDDYMEKILADVDKAKSEEAKKPELAKSEEKAFATVNKEKPSAENFQEELKEVIEEYTPTKTETVSISDESSGSIGLIEFARRNVIEKPENDSVEIAAELTTDDILAEYDEALEDGIEPLIDGVQLDEPEEADENIDDLEKTRIVDVPGQISIEKTRPFNEVEARAVRDEKIPHHIGENKIIRTGELSKGSKMETDPYRERFLNKPVIDIEKTQEHKELLSKLPPKTIEKHGVIVRKPDNEKTSEDGLSPVPILVDALDEYEAQKKLEVETQTGSLSANALEELDNQIVLDGFSEDEEIDIVDEYEAEAKLRRVRKERADKFKLFPNLNSEDNEDEVEQPEEDLKDEDYSEAEKDDVEEEYTKPQEKVRVLREFFGPKDSKPVYDLYLKEKNNAKLRLIVAAVMLALLMVSSIATSFFGSFSMFADSPMVYSAINLLLLVIAAAINHASIGEGLAVIKKRIANKGTAIAVSLTAAIIQCVVGFGFGDIILSGTHIYAAVAVFIVLLINIGEYIAVKNDIDNFILLNTEQGKFYAVKQVEDESEAFEIGRGLMIKDPDVRYSAKVSFPYKFVEMSKTKDPTKDIYTLVLPVAALAALIVGVIAGIVNKNFFVGISAMTGVLLMGIPSASVISAADGLRRTNKALYENGALISGYEAVDDAISSNAVVIDSADLFENSNSTIYGIKLFNSMRIDEAILYTAAVVIQSNGALKEVFDGIILSKREMLPQVESLAYEEKLGCSGWIYNYRVLVGTRELLIKHNVEVWSKEEEAKFTKNGRRVLYLAVEGKVAAMFVVSYVAQTSTAKYMQRLERSGISILVRTTDANITEEYVEQYFDLPHNFIKVISPVAGLMFKELSEKEAVNEPCRIVHNGKINSLLRSFSAAFTVFEKHKIGMILQYIGIGLGIVIMALLSFLSGLTQAGVTQVIIFEAFWAAIVVLVPRLKKI